MALTYVNRVSLGINPSCMAIRPIQNDVLVGTYQPNIKRFDLNALTLLATYTLTNSPGQLVLLNSASTIGACALIMYPNSNNFDLLEISSGYRQTYTGGLEDPDVHGGTAAYDPSTNCVMAACSTANKLVLFNANTFTVTNSYIPQYNSTATFSSNFRSVTLKGPGRWVVAGVNGIILEVDNNFNCYKQIWLTNDSCVKYYSATNNLFMPYAFNITLWNDILYYHGGAQQFQIGYGTGDVLSRELCGSWFSGSSNTFSYMGACQAVCGITLVFGGANNTKVLFELDITTTPPTIRDMATTDGFLLVDAQINTLAGNSAAIDATNWLYTFTVQGRALTNVAVQLNPGGIPTDGEVLMYDVTDNKLWCHVTVPAAGSTISVPSGKTFWQISRVYSGTDEEWDITTFNS